jgi:hypothetical protein
MEGEKEQGLGYAELSNALQLARRKCRGHRSCVNMHWKFLEACLAYTRKNLRILGAGILQRLAVAFKELGIVKPRAKFLSRGEAKALEMLVQYRRQGVFKWAPRIEKWLYEVGYRLWLGAMDISLTNSFQLNNPMGTRAKGQPCTEKIGVG